LQKCTATTRSGAYNLPEPFGTCEVTGKTLAASELYITANGHTVSAEVWEATGKALDEIIDAAGTLDVAIGEGITPESKQLFRILQKTRKLLALWYGVR